MGPPPEVLLIIRVEVLWSLVPESSPWPWLSWQQARPVLWALQAAGVGAEFRESLGVQAGCEWVQQPWPLLWAPLTPPPRRLAQPSLQENGPSVLRAGLCQAAPNKGALVCSVLECQPAAGVRDGPPQCPPPGGLGSSHTAYQAVPTQAQLQALLSPALLVPVARGTAFPDPPRNMPWAAGALLLMAAPRCGPGSGGLRVAPWNRPSGQPLEGPGEGSRVPEPPALLQCSCSSPQTWAGTASCTWRRSATAGLER